jgi:hypothetical protein
MTPTCVAIGVSPYGRLLMEKSAGVLKKRTVKSPLYSYEKAHIGVQDILTTMSDPAFKQLLEDTIRYSTKQIHSESYPVLLFCSQR